MIRFCITLILILTAFSCEKEEEISKDLESFKAQIKNLSDKKPSPKNKDSILMAWKNIEENPLIKKDTELQARAKYYVGRVYGMSGEMDSSQIYVEKALELIEKTKGNLDTKAFVYSGMGNLSNSKAKEHQANYYYNKAATIVLSSDSLEMPPVAKTIILLSGAQSNNVLYQYDLAQKMNKAALDLSPQLSPFHTNRQRPLTQMIMVFGKQDKLDSIPPYIRKLEQLQKESPKEYNIKHLYDSKSRYFELTKKPDFLLYYQKLKANLDEESLIQDPQEQVNINNLLNSYLNISAVYIVKKNIPEAKEYLQLSTQLIQENKELISFDANILYKENLSKLLNLEGKSREAFELMQEVSELQKENFETENTQAVAEMNSLSQLQAKDKSINSLSKNIKINELQLQQNKLWLLITSLLALLLITFIGFFYYNYRQRRVVQEKEKLLNQQQLLRTQMEPHFIFNTLSALQSFVRLDKKEEAIKYLNQFSRLLRSSMELSRENLVPLGEEMEALNNYLSLQQMRFEDAFTYEVIRPEGEDTCGIMVPPMLLQPYVENAILHGIDLSDGSAHIKIQFFLKDGILHANITDSGKNETNETVKITARYQALSVTND
ncbi:histidine kinase [Epilithonimonas xixisoli]|uniref:Histidine kinase n=2 Tax=Epilithonimonas xixisoli TaxID=1476462 RepID=A0A4R8IBV5_9FLAO|nr:histidine kinase [Epilithonimonas xixisoli]